MDISLLYQLFLDSDGVTTDSRQSVSKKIFFALQGPNFDGSQFISEVLEAGAHFVVTSNVKWKGEKHIALVDDVLRILQQLANYHRKRLAIPVLAITGSNGKTTTKELVYRLLSEKYKVHATSGNFNNLIGLPLTILSANSRHEMMVLEMGSNAFGEIARLCQIAEPDFGIITNIGSAHLEGFESLTGVLNEKTALYRDVASRNGMLFVPGNSPELMSSVEHFSNKVVYQVGDQPIQLSAFIQIKLSQVVPSIVGSFMVEDDIKDFDSHLFGIYNAQNCAAAIAIATFFEVPVVGIVRALSYYIPSNNRSQLIKSKNLTVVLDAYNANPVSMAKALDMIDDWPSENKIVVLGDMKELGDYSADAHAMIVQRVKAKNYSFAFFVGSEFQNCTDAAFQDVDALGLHLKASGFEVGDGVVLVKGSRSMQLEKILPALAIDIEQV